MTKGKKARVDGTKKAHDSRAKDIVTTNMDMDRAE